MTREDLQKLPVYQTSRIETACKDLATKLYVIACLKRFYSGDYGELDAEDVAANERELESGEGHVLGRYKTRHNLGGDIYIESYFSESLPWLMDSNYTTILHRNER